MARETPLTELPRALIEAGYESARYRELYTAAVDGRIPATRQQNGRWAFTIEDLPAIADKMGLMEAHAA